MKNVIIAVLVLIIVFGGYFTLKKDTAKTVMHQSKKVVDKTTA